MTKRNTLLKSIRNAVIGSHHEITGPFGSRLVTYADYTASGRSLSFIEDALREHILPYYGNTHTESSGTGLQTTRFREDAREVIKKALGCTDADAVIFTGSGATAAINKVIDILNLRLPANLADRYRFLEQIPLEERPVIFIGPYEHHSNEIPWRESIADVVVIDEDDSGRPDDRLLEEELKRYATRPLRIGSFSAASNVTGIATDTRGISALLHRHGALAFWDCAAAAPYVEINMAPSGPDLQDGMDAVFISPHKFIGGPGTPGILALKKRLIDNRVPSVPGGGTVAYVGPTEHRYIDDLENREEGGTPEIIGAIRAGMVFQLKNAVGVDLIRRREDSFIHRALQRWSANPNLSILGNLDAPRLSIVSFMVRYGKRYLHHNFVVTLLNDLFGIQTRGGCSCAGPYGHRLLGIDLVRSHEFEREILRGSEGIKPGWTRINFNYFISDTVFHFLLDAIDFVAEHGWRFLPMYRFSPETALWVHQEWRHHPTMRLVDFEYHDGQLVFPHRHQSTDESAFGQYLSNAMDLAARLPSNPPGGSLDNTGLTGDFESLRWFPLPHEVSLDT